MIHKMKTTSAEKRIRLFNTAAGQFGFFTAKQAENAGYERNHFHSHAASGEWVQEQRGLYRLTNFPQAPEQEYIKWLLWSRNKADVVQGCLSHETALSIYELGDNMPNQIHITVPLDFRRAKETPALVRLHRENLLSGSIQVEKGLAVTSPAKTFEDLLKEGLTELPSLKEALAKALDRGLITRRQLSASQLLTNLEK